MGKHDKHIEMSSEEFMQNRIKDLEKRLTFAEENCKQLREHLDRANKLIHKVEADAEETITELQAENVKLRGKIVKLVENYV